MKMINKTRSVTFLNAIFLLSTVVIEVNAAGVAKAPAGTQARTTATAKAPAPAKTAVTATKTATASTSTATGSAPVAAPASAATVQARATAAAEQADTKILNLVKRFGAAKGQIVTDAQANMTTANTEAEKAAVRTAFFNEIKEVFNVKGLAKTDVGYQNTRYKFKLLLKMLAGQATDQDLNDVCTTMLAGGRAAHPEFATDMITTYQKHDFLSEADKATVAGWLSNGYNGITFDAANCYPAPGTVVTVVAATKTATGTAPAPAKAVAPAPKPGVKASASGR